MSSDIISILKGNRISARNEKRLRDVVGVKTTKKIIEEARKQGLTDLGKGKETQKRRAYRYFADIFNDTAYKEREKRSKKMMEKGIVTFDVKYMLRVKGKGYTFPRNVSYALSSARGFTENIIKRAIDREVKKLLDESPLELISTEVSKEKFMLQKKNPTSIRKTKLKQNGVLNLDQHIDNSVWCKNRDMCVVDFIQHRLAKSDRHKKKTTDEAIQRLSISGKNNDVDKFPNANGYTIEHIENYCFNNDLSMYALSDGKLVEQWCPLKPNHNNVPLVFTIANNHLYPIFDKGAINSIVRSKGNIKSNNIQKGKVKSNNKLEVEIVELEENETPFEATIRIVKRERTMIYPSSHIYTTNGSLNGFTLNNKRYILNYDSNIQDYYGEEYRGQTQSTMISEMPMWENLPTSYFNPEVDYAMSAVNVKNRNHYGLIDENIPIYENMNCLDIKRCFRACMENPLEEFMIIPFNTHISNRWGKYPYALGLYYINTNDMSIAHGSNWYSNSMLNKLTNKNIKFKISAFIKGVGVGKTLLKDLIEYVNSKVKNGDLNKLVINCISGMLGKTESKTTNLKMDTDVNRLWSEMTQLALDNQNFVVNQEEDIYSFGITQTSKWMNNNLPMYIQILDFANIRLAEMAESMGGKIVARKTDCVVTTAPQQNSSGNNVGDYRLSEHPKITAPQIPVSFRKAKLLRYDKLEFLKNDKGKEWSSNHYETLLKKLEDNNGLCIVGEAGTGKSYCIEKMRELIGEDKCVSVAFTNKAAININGSTIHKMLKINIDGKIDKKYIKKLFKNKKYLIAEEFGMIPATIWKILAEVKRLTGVGFLLVGDSVNQLPPIEDKDEINGNYLNHSVVSYLSNGKAVELTKIFRYDMELKKFVTEKKWDSITPIEFSYDMIDDTNITFFNDKRKRINEIGNRLKKTDDSILCEVDWTDSRMEHKYHQDTYLYVGLPIIANTTYKNLELRKNEFYKITEMTDTTFTFSNEFNTQTIPITEYHKYFLMGYAFSVYKSQSETFNGIINIFDYEYLKRDDRFIYSALTRATALKNIRYVNL